LCATARMLLHASVSRLRRNRTAAISDISIGVPNARSGEVRGYPYPEVRASRTLDASFGYFDVGMNEPQVFRRGSSRRGLGTRLVLLQAAGDGAEGVRPWRCMISANLARSGGPPAAELMTWAHSRKNCGPSAAGVTMQSAFTSWVVLLSNR
jgi:hypothetical protein